MKRFPRVGLYLACIVMAQFLVAVLFAAEISTAQQPYLLQLRGVITRSAAGDKLEQALWMTEALDERLAEHIVLSQNPSDGLKGFKLLALDAQKQQLSEAVIRSRTSGDLVLDLDLVLPRGTAFVELRAPDGSLVQNGAQTWPEQSQAPRLSALQSQGLEYGGRRLQVSWACYGTYDGFALWYTPNKLDWYFLERTTTLSSTLDLSDLPGGQLEDNRFGELRLVASNGLATSELGLRIEVDWLEPQIYVLEVPEGQTLAYDRTATIDLRAQAWDVQEQWQIFDRILWLNERGAIISRESNLLLPAERYPVGRYVLQAMTMNQRQRIVAQKIDVLIKAALRLESSDAPYFDRDGGLWVPLRSVMDAAGWWLGYDTERREIQLNGYETTYTIAANGDLWLDGIWRGQVQLWNRANRNWISAQDLTLLGFAYLQWDTPQQTLLITPE